MVQKQTQTGLIQTIAMVGILCACVFGIVAIMDTIRDVERMVGFIERIDERDKNIESRLIIAEQRNKEDANYNKMFNNNRVMLENIEKKLEDQQKQINLLLEQVIKNGIDSARDGPVIQE